MLGINMSIFDGQRVVNIRQRMLAYCEQQKIEIPAAFHSLDTVYAIALVDVSVSERLRLVGQTFYNAASVLQYLKDTNKHPANYRVLDFKRGTELVLAHEIGLERGPSFDSRKDVDIQR